MQREGDANKQLSSIAFHLSATRKNPLGPATRPCKSIACSVKEILRVACSVKEIPGLACIQNTVHLPHIKAAIPIYHVRWRPSKANDHQQKPDQPAQITTVISSQQDMEAAWKLQQTKPTSSMKQTNDCTEPLQTKPTSSKKQTKGCPEPRADHQKPPPCTSANIDNVMVFFIKWKTV